VHTRVDKLFGKSRQNEKKDEKKFFFVCRSSFFLSVLVAVLFPMHFPFFLVQVGFRLILNFSSRYTIQLQIELNRSVPGMPNLPELRDVLNEKYSILKRQNY
jgi:hypothetical protein